MNVFGGQIWLRFSPMEDADRVARLRNQADEVRPDETGAADHQHIHCSSLLRFREYERERRVQSKRETNQ
jgi:hypothetical protein